MFDSLRSLIFGRKGAQTQSSRAAPEVSGLDSREAEKAAMQAMNEQIIKLGIERLPIVLLEQIRAVRTIAQRERRKANAFLVDPWYDFRNAVNHIGELEPEDRRRIESYQRETTQEGRFLMQCARTNAFQIEIPDERDDVGSLEGWRRNTNFAHYREYWLDITERVQVDELLHPTLAALVRALRIELVALPEFRILLCDRLENRSYRRPTRLPSTREIYLSPA